MEKNMKRKPQVSLPGGIASLVHRAQGLQEGVPQTSETSAAQVQREPVAVQEPVAASTAQAQAAAQVREEIAAAKPKPLDRCVAWRAEGLDSWSLMVSTARAYKEYPGKLATVYIDSDLKRILDGLRASGMGVSTSSLLSSIVASFVSEHHAEIRRQCEF